MDVVDILRVAAEKLPEGEYSTGLRAILRHLESAIRHYQRDPTSDPDCYTDSIYRTNQAYEGSLKEAYRVLAGKDPAKRTPNEIEDYLESNKVLRPRVLIQLTRYRQDYRNPSTHDYKLDFDANEALLAIVSVTAFGKLLVDQVAEKVAFDQSLTNAPSAQLKLAGNNHEISRKIAEYIRDILNRDDKIQTQENEFRGFLSGQLVAAGLDVNENYESTRAWDMVISTAKKKFAMETRKGNLRQSRSHIMPFHYLSAGIKEDKLQGGMVVTRSPNRGQYGVLYLSSEESEMLYFVTKMDAKTVQSRLSSYWKIGT